MKHTLTPLAALVTVTLLTGCAKGLDRKPSFASLAAYQQSAAEIKPEITETQAIAYTYAVSGNNTFETLAQKYNGQTFRQIALSELDTYIEQNQAQLTEYETQAEKAARIVSELQKVTARGDNPLLKKDLLGNDKLTYTVRIANQGKLDFSTLNLTARLYLDEAQKASASETMTLHFQKQGGLRAGQSATQTVDAENFFSKDWTSLAVKNAKQRRVELSIDNGTDFANNAYVDETLDILHNKAATQLNDAKNYRQAIAAN